MKADTDDVKVSIVTGLARVQDEPLVQLDTFSSNNLTRFRGEPPLGDDVVA